MDTIKDITGIADKDIQLINKWCRSINKTLDDCDRHIQIKDKDNIRTKV